MTHGSQRFPIDHGQRELGFSRHLVLHGAQVFWLALGAWLYLGSYWPSTCTPQDLLDVYACSTRLPESGRWQEGALLTWLWSTPLLALLEICRWLPRSSD